jgi:subtilisin family serine protease
MITPCTLKQFTLLLCGFLLVALAEKTAARIKTTSHSEAVPGVVALALKEPLPAGAVLQRSGIPALDQAMQSLQIHRLDPVVPASLQRLQKHTSPARIDNLYYAFYSGALAPETVAAQLAKNPSIEFAEAKYYSQLSAMPNDPYVNRQYYINKIRLPQAWDISKGEQGEVIIAIIDGGTDITHPDLKGNLWTNPGEIAGNNLDDDANGYIDDLHGWNFANNSANPASLFSGTSYANHGTHTAGCACAVTHNALGIAGTSWNARLMAINAGAKTSESKIDPLSIDKGIVYAIAHGADIISCSFSGSYSEVTRRLLENALSEGAAIIAAAGNGSTRANDTYPASYPGVMAVAATDSSDIKPYFSNYGTTIDVAAPGEGIWSTIAGGYYEGPYWQGTSMSTPITAGVVALVMTHHPEWSGLQAAEQVRMTADNIDARNPAYAGLLGRGRINALRALSESWPSIRISGINFYDQDGDSLIEPGETVTLSLTLTNYLASAQNIGLEISESSEYASFSRRDAQLSALATGESIRLDKAFSFKVTSGAPSDHTINFTLTISGDGFNDSDHFSLTVLPSFANIGVNNIYTTITSIGRIGNANPGGESRGLGFLYKAGESLLFEGALIAGTGANKIVNAARGVLDFNDVQLNDADFRSTEGGDVRIITPGVLTDQESQATYSDGLAAAPLAIRITQKTFASSQTRYADIILMRFMIENLSGRSLENFHFGIFCDWDIDANSYATNIAAYDPERRLGYAYDTGTGPGTHAGIRLLTPGGISYRAIINDHTDPLNPGWALHDGFTDAEKWEAISGGLSLTRLGPADISNIIASGPHSIGTDGSLTIDFALVAADDLPLLQAASDKAQTLWQDLLITHAEPDPGPAQPTAWGLAANYPNPFNSGTAITFTIPAAAPVRLEILDLSGRLVRRLLDAATTAGTHQLAWDGNDERGRSVASGTYLYRLCSDSRQLIRKLVLLR